jgi:hypothetical protein
MIKGAGTKDGLPLLILGISGENVTRLAAGEPILIHASEMRRMGLPAIEVLITYGKTEQAILDDLAAAGMAAPVERR